MAVDSGTPPEVSKESGIFLKDMEKMQRSILRRPKISSARIMASGIHTCVKQHAPPVRREFLVATKKARLV
jgi:hypothetical protein